MTDARIIADIIPPPEGWAVTVVTEGMVCGMPFFSDKGKMACRSLKRHQWPHGIGNLSTLCRPCNSSKGTLTWMEWRVSRRPRALLVFIAA